jgi:archaeal flagellin FlaB
MKILKILGNIKADDNAMVGIGVLIVFIAMVLISAVAASVLIQTTEQMSNKARNVANGAIDQISSGVRITDAYGYADENRTRIEYIGVVIRTTPGSNVIDISQMKIIVQSDDLNVLSFDNNTVENIDRCMFTSINLSNLSNVNFGVISLYDRDNSVVNAYGLDNGDRALVVFNLSAIMEQTPSMINLKVVPESGHSTEVEIQIPVAYGFRTINLFV